MKEIPLTDLRPHDQKLKQEIDRALQQVIEHGKFVDHETVRKFEKAFAELLQIGFCFGLRSGADAIFLALCALEIGPGDEVITAPNASPETASAICRTGAKIRFVDMNPLTLNIDVAKIERAISYNTRVLLPVHLFGQPAELGYLLKLADRHGLYLVEDATQACGAAYRGKPVGTFGDVACFGFGPENNLGAYGDAGAIITNNEELAAKVWDLCESNVDAKKKRIEGYFLDSMDAIQAAVLQIKLKHLPAWNEERRRIATVYHGFFKKNERIQTVTEQDGLYSVYSRFVIQVDNREEVRQKLVENGIGAGIHSSVPLHKQQTFAHFLAGEHSLPVAESVAPRLLSLPIDPHLSTTVVENAAMKVLEAVDSF